MSRRQRRQTSHTAETLREELDRRDSRQALVTEEDSRQESTTAGEAPQGGKWPPRWPAEGGYFAAAAGAIAGVIATVAAVGALSVLTGEQDAGGQGVRQARPAASEPAASYQRSMNATEAGKIVTATDKSTMTLTHISGDARQTTLTADLPSSPTDPFTLTSEEGDISASYTSILSEAGRRSWLIVTRDASRPGYLMESAVATDPSEAAAAGAVPISNGTYVVKAVDGSLTASGTYTDVVVAGRRVERTYDETYMSATSGEEDRHRQWRVRFEATATAASVTPTLVGYSPAGKEVSR